ncbi:acyl-CoA dehydrogenase [Acinetobacter suaedae]|uniref:3-methylmercaptopropionyl-CoA dehydrogenase n=1 Tax=Acinetobacter suaedae TaxID=2609668 RepID=A0A5P1UWN4_9GAMM|nr:acyl-CoA dehydrogenase C-terminal domain-containing protein [Acinetobacter sp. C16S1]QER40240.1 acyl-CoA dehydrogenase [Acinetobacter sp. C16S1]
MPNYISPLRDINFVLNDFINFEKIYERYPQSKDKMNSEIVDQYLQVAADFCENELYPLNRVGDQQGCKLRNGIVTTPDGFKEAYKKYVELGFPALTGDEAYGGQGFPSLLWIAISEILTSCNWAWGMYPGLSHGAMSTIEHHGTDEQKKNYLPKLISGVWTGTMCLTESHAGSDLGLIRTKALPNNDGSYVISGEKIFISAGEHDLSQNIVHIVLARLPNAPAGTKGISLFIVPKFNIDQDGNILDRNGVVCSALEHKMGIHGNATCALSFDNAKGFLIGPENRGLHCMFTFMNSARIGTAIQGLAASESSYQGALAYAKDRLAMRSLSGPQNPELSADPIIVHPAVRNMLLTQKVFAEGSRALAYYLSVYVDIAKLSNDESEKKIAEDKLALLTPIAKAFMTEMGVESAKNGMQVFGGHGYIAEHGMEQIARDVRISTLYEGTTEIQSIDLLFRKVLGSKGELIKLLIEEIKEETQHIPQHEEIASMYIKLENLVKEWHELTTYIQEELSSNPVEVGTISVDYLYFSSYVIFAYLWLKMAMAAQDKISQESTDEFYPAKIATAEFYFERILPRTLVHAELIKSQTKSLFKLSPHQFKFD